MKIFYIVNARIPTEKAHGVQIMKMCEAFVKNGADIELIVPKRKLEKGKETDPFVVYGIEHKFPIKRIWVLDFYKFGYFGFLAGSLSFSINSFLYVLFKRGRFVVYSRDQDQFSFFSVPFLPRPYFFEIHGLKKRNTLHRLLFSRIKGVVATNSFIKNKLLENFKKLKDKTVLLPNGVDVKKFQSVDKNSAREKLSLPRDKKIILYAGHLYKWKGAETLVDATNSLEGDIDVYLVGGADADVDRIKEERKSISENVYFVGHQDYSKIPLWFSAADVLIITGTKTDKNSVYYTSPIKLFECMASGRPVVAADSPSIRDVVSDKEVCFYTPDNEADLAAKIKGVLANDDLISKKTENAQEKVKQYDWSKRAEKILQFVRSKTSL